MSKIKQILSFLFKKKSRLEKSMKKHFENWDNGVH